MGSPEFAGKLSVAHRVTVDEARRIAREAYVFGYPLVFQVLRREVLTAVSSPHSRKAPLNQFAHVREFPDASARDVAGFNVDTLYSLARCSLADEPLVLHVPELGDRYWLMQLLDGWTDTFGAPGTRTVGGAGGTWAICGADWAGTLPDGVEEIRAPGELVTIGGRTYTAGVGDFTAVRDIQDTYQLVPLSGWDREWYPPAVTVDSSIDGTTPPPDQVAEMDASTFFGRLAAAMAGNPPRAADAPIVERMARLGIGAGAAFDTAALPHNLRVAIEAGAREGFRAIRANAPSMAELVDGWQIAYDVGRFGTSYLDRATWAMFAIGGNWAEDALYPLTRTDADGHSITGDHEYVLRFEAGGLPPVEAFWSVTMYDAQSYLVDNPINRFALGDRSDLAYGEDGSLELFLQRHDPGGSRTRNWLPTPEGPATATLRLYWPKAEVLDRTWRPPPIRRTA